MKIEALNCPNCGAGVSSDKTQCIFCHSRLKTMACASCFGLMFQGSKHCSHCGKKAIQTEIKAEENPGDCPRCKINLNLLQIGEITLRECQKCDGIWANADTFEAVCANHESQAAVLSVMAQKHSENKTAVRYVPCPVCRQLMNRNNFARSSGVIIDICKQHGVWFDAEELPKIIEFIRKGGLDHAREREKLQIKEQRKMLVEQQRKLAREDAR
jgi:Zn-finger nucleic acid-binding protein